MANFNWADGFAQSAVPQEWLKTKGAGIRIAILDTGFNVPPELLESLKKKGKIFNTDLGQPVAGGTGEVNLADGPANSFGHGTPCLSIVAAKKVTDSAGNTITGLAPSADYFLIKTARSDGGLTRWKHLLDGLKIALDKKADLVITGYGLTTDAKKTLPDAEIEAVFKRMRESGTLLVATWANAADSEVWKDKMNKYWPANRAETLAVGRMPEANLAARLGEVRQTPGIHFLVEKLANGSVMAGSNSILQIEPAANALTSKTAASNSFAAYAFGGALACMLSFFKKNPLPGQAVKWDKQSARAAFAAGCLRFSQADGQPQTMNFYRNQ